MNLPNALTVGRIVVTPLIAVLPFATRGSSVSWRSCCSRSPRSRDYIDGKLARSRKEETDLGRLLDPLADKALLVGTFVPMYLLAADFPFVTPFGAVGLPLWIIAVVLGRELFMTVFRQAAARRGVVIAAIGPAKWKTGFQLVWQGSAYFWFFAATLAAAQQWNDTAWHGFALFNGIVGTPTMTAAIVLTIYSLVLYLRSFGSVFAASPSK